MPGVSPVISFSMVTLPLLTLQCIGHLGGGGIINHGNVVDVVTQPVLGVSDLMSAGEGVRVPAPALTRV